jgi:hypothetical protein
MINAQSAEEEYRDSNEKKLQDFFIRMQVIGVH